jgi:hypothetical protein
MTNFSQLPRTNNLAFVKGDEVSFTEAFAGLDLTGHTLSAGIFNSSIATVTNVVTPTLSLATATSGGVVTSTVTVSLSETNTSALATNVRYRWFLRYVTPGGKTITAVSGAVSCVNP